MSVFLPQRTWRWITTPLHGLATATTAFRIHRRHHKGKLWWDDYFAAISLFFDVALTTMPWLRRETSNPHESKERRIIIYWMTALLYPLVVWTAQISIGFSIARLVPSQTRMRQLLYAMNGTFALMCCAALFQKIWICSRNDDWHNNPVVQCYIGLGLGILTLCNVVADTCLVTISFRMLWRIKLPGRQKRLILSIFASSVLTSIVGVVYSAFVFIFNTPQGHTPRWGYPIAFIAHFKCAMTLLVCNLLVVVTYLYCVLRKDEDDNDDLSEPSEIRSIPPHSSPITNTLTLTEISGMQTV